MCKAERGKKRQPMIRAHKIRLNPTPEQANFLNRAAGVSRFTYNWALAEWKRQYEDGGRPSGNTLKKQFNSIKREQFPFVMDVMRDASASAFARLDVAFKNFFDGLAGKRPRMGYPKFKSKKRSKKSFAIANDTFRVDGHNVYIPRLGFVNMTERLRFNGKIMSGTISESAGRWYISIAVEMGKPEPVEFAKRAVGIDLGLKTLATLSDGREFENQKFLRRDLGKLKRLNRELSRRQQGSNRWLKTKLKLQRFHEQVQRRRQDAVHKATHEIASTYQFIGLEDLNVSGMVRNRRLALSVSDAGMGEIVRQIEYKSEWYGGQVQKVDRWFASSKLCNNCGHKHARLALSDRQWVCENCGTLHNRDWNASKNIEQEALRLAYA